MQPTLSFGSCLFTRAWGWQPDTIQNTVHFPANFYPGRCGRHRYATTDGIIT